MRCINRGDVVDPRRVEIGYDYCTKDECQERYLSRVRVARVAVNKAADQFVRADDVLPPQGPAPATVDTDAEDHPVSGRPRRPPTVNRARPSTLQKLRRLASELDAALERSYERFRRGEVTAAEMDQERNELIRVFNERVRAENIRYRSMLRKYF